MWKSDMLKSGVSYPLQCFPEVRTLPPTIPALSILSTETQKLRTRYCTTVWMSLVLQLYTVRFTRNEKISRNVAMRPVLVETYLEVVR